MISKIVTYQTPSQTNIFLTVFKPCLNGCSTSLCQAAELKQVVDRLFAEEAAPNWIGARPDALRRIEAALFMLGKDIPRTRGQVSATVLTYDQALAEVTVNIASYFAALLVDQGLAEYRRQGQTGGELRIR